MTIIDEQLSKLSNVPQRREGESIIFSKDNSTSNSDTIKVIFENYFAEGFEGFTFHRDFNNDIKPFAKIMYGTLIKETDKMYKLSLHTDSDPSIWEGWCPKKCCKIFKM